MDDLNAFLARLYHNLHLLQEREAKYLGNAPVGLLNQLEDYRTAIGLAEQAKAGQLSQRDLDTELARLNLELPPGPTLPPVIPALHQLPAPPADFTGRTAELSRLTAAIAHGGATISGLRGLGGIGKTTLALKLAQSLTPAYPDAQFYLDLRGASPTPLTPAEALAHVIRAYHPTAKLPASETELAGLYRSALHGQRALLLMDNAASAAQVTPLLPPPGCLLLVTSRQHFTLPGLYAENLDALPPEDAQALLLKIAPRLTPPRYGEGEDSFPPLPQGEGPGVRVESPPTPTTSAPQRLRSSSPLASLASLCGYLPLALRLAASALAERPDLSLESYLRRLSQTQKRLELIEASLSLSYDLLTPELQQLWCTLAVFPADFDLPAAAAVWNLDPDEADERIGELLKYSLVEYGQRSGGAGGHGRATELPSPTGRGVEGEGEGRYRLHDLARLYAASRMNPAARAEAELRHAEHYETVYRRATEFYKRGGDNTLRGLAIFDRDWPNIQAGQAWAEQNSTVNDTAASLCNAYVTWPYLLELRQHPRQRLAWLLTALAAARRLSNRLMESVHLNNLGRAYEDLGETHRAIEYYEQGLAIARDIGHQRSEGHALGGLGRAYANLGEIHRSIEFYQRRLVISHDIGDRRGEGAALGDLGNAYADLGEIPRAIKYYERYLTIAYEIGDRRGEAIALGNLGNAYYDLGETRQAIEYYEQCLTRQREIGDRRGEGTALWNKALALDKLGERAQTIACAEAALQIYEQIESPHAKKVRAQLAQWRGENH